MSVGNERPTNCYWDRWKMKKRRLRRLLLPLQLRRNGQTKVQRSEECHTETDLVVAAAEEHWVRLVEVCCCRKSGVLEWPVVGVVGEKSSNAAAGSGSSSASAAALVFY